MKEIIKVKAERFKTDLLQNSSYNTSRANTFYSDIEAFATRFRRDRYESQDPKILEIVDAFFSKNNDVQFNNLIIEYVFEIGIELDNESYSGDKDSIVHHKLYPIFKAIGTRLFLNERVSTILSKSPFME